MTNPIIIDTETTGLKAPQAIEVAYIKLNPNLEKLHDRYEQEELLKFDHYAERFKPSKPIEAGASRVNKIYMKDVENCRPTSEFKLPEHSFFIAHNANFDFRVLNKPETTLICTKELAQIAFDKDFSNGQLRNHKLTTLIEYICEQELAHRLLDSAHGALGDCVMTYHLLVEISNRLPHCKTFQDLANLCNQPGKLKPFKPGKIHFGKHKGTLYTEIPEDYLQWLSKQNPDESVKRQIDHALELLK